MVFISKTGNEIFHLTLKNNNFFTIRNNLCAYRWFCNEDIYTNIYTYVVIPYSKGDNLMKPLLQLPQFTKGNLTGNHVMEVAEM